MNETKIKPYTTEGWAIHFYDKNRHLRFTLEASHFWIFSLGVATGILVTISCLALFRSSAQNQYSANPLPKPNNTSENTIRADPTPSFPLGID